MATPPDFSVGGVLTAAQMDQIGLWKVIPTSATGGTVNSDGSVTIGSAVSTVELAGVFSSSFANYRVLIRDVQSSVSQALCVQWGSSAVSYFGMISYTPYNGTAWNVANNNNDSKQFIALTDSTAPSLAVSMDIYQPNLAKRTFISGQYFARGYAGIFGGSHEVTTAYTSFKVFNETGTLTGGTITVYGYN